MFLIFESEHNNYYIFYCYTLALAPFTKMDAAFSLDAVWFHRRHRGPKKTAPRKVPFWHHFIWQIMFSIPYFFGSVAKLNYDWVCSPYPLNQYSSEHELYTPTGTRGHRFFAKQH